MTFKNTPQRLKSQPAFIFSHPRYFKSFYRSKICDLVISRRQRRSIHTSCFFWFEGVPSSRCQKPVVPAAIGTPKKEDVTSLEGLTTPPNSPVQVENLNGPPKTNWSTAETSFWLQENRYSSHLSHNLSSYSGADLLRLSRDDLIQLCGLSDGIRLYNALHVRPICNKLTLYMCIEPREHLYQAIYLSQLSPAELLHKACLALSLSMNQVSGLFILGPADIKVLPTKELISQLPDNAAYSVQLISDGQEKYQMLLKLADLKS